jgi:sugar phosphate isomerase/epimerase
MKYLKRLKNELLDLTEKLAVKGPLPEYVSIKKRIRRNSIRVVVEMIKMARALDQAIDYYTDENAGAWEHYLRELEDWLKLAPSMPPKLVAKKNEVVAVSV